SPVGRVVGRVCVTPALSYAVHIVAQWSTRKMLLTMDYRTAFWLLSSLSVLGLCYGEDVYVGKSMGELNSYHHQVGGEVYAVDSHKFLIKNFMYDGYGRDTFFWAGSTPRPGPQGFIVPNERGRTNKLEGYLNKDITIVLPDGKSIKEIKWLSVYDLSRLETFGDVYIPEGFEAPQRETLNKISSKSGEIKSGPVIIVDSKTIVISEFTYGGSGEEVYFWVGVGPQPHSQGQKIPDEYGYMTPLGQYKKKSITLQIPGDKDVFTIDWLAVYDIKNEKVLGSMIIPNELNIPPSLVKVIPHESTLPNCEMLHKDLMISWEVFGDVITVEIAGQIEEDEYVSFGMSGDPTKPKMEGADVVVLFMDGYQGYMVDHTISSYMPCTKIIGQYKGVCDDDLAGGAQNYQPYSTKRENGISIFTFRRPLVTPDPGDTPYPAKGEAMIVWAIGKRTELNKPEMHFKWSKFKQPLKFKRPVEKKCFAFSRSEMKPKIKPWKATHLANSQLREYHARLGPDGGPRGYQAITGHESETGLAWYMNGYLAPHIYLKRNVKYKFYIEGGSYAYDPRTYHPMIITDEPYGAYSQLDEDQKKEVRILAGIGYTGRGEVRPTKAGRLCIWQHNTTSDRRKDIEYPTFERYRNSLELDCGDGDAAVLEFTPNKTWPDTAYYNSWTGAKMGWKLHILDEVNTEEILEKASSSISLTPSSLLRTLLLGLLLAIRL
ncbi:unnamed protein product, partial [Meganyctiphanes norvegica]